MIVSMLLNVLSNFKYSFFYQFCTTQIGFIFTGLQLTSIEHYIGMPCGEQNGYPMYSNTQSFPE